MKKIIFSLIGILFLTTGVLAEQMQVELPKTVTFDNQSVRTVGILQGGGSLIGVDFENMINEQWSWQAGIGLVGLGAGINYHLKPKINSDFISLQIWNQGLFGDSLTQRVIGIAYVFRGEAPGFTGQLGIGYAIERSAKFIEQLENIVGKGNVTSLMLVYSLGWWF